jgi:hypothetical protein
MWDGTIIEYSSNIRKYSGLLSYFIESTWFLQYPLSLGVINLSDILSISYKNTNAVIVFLFMVVLLRESFLIAKNQIKLPNTTAYFAITLLATSSVWGDLLSSIMTLHLGCIALGLLSVRTIHTGNSVIGFIGFLCLAISLSLQSQLVYLPILSYLYDLSRLGKSEKTLLIKPSFKTIQIFLVCIILYVAVRLFFPPHGQYENYNNLALTSIYGLLTTTIKTLIFTTYLAPIILIVFTVSLITDSNINNSKHVVSKVPSINPKWLMWLMILFFAGAFPYAVVGKVSIFGDLGDWSSRQAFLLMLPVSLISATYLQIMYEKAVTPMIKKIILASGFSIILLNMILLFGAAVFKLNRQIFVLQLENQIKLHESKIQPGLLEIVGDGVPGPLFREYESNFLMYSATGKANWWTRIGNKDDNNFHIPCYIQKNLAYQTKYIYNFNENHIKNHTIVKIEVTNFKDPLNILRNSFGLGSSGNVNIISIEQTYQKSKEKYECI